MHAITKEHKIKYHYFAFEKVTKVHLEGDSYRTLMGIYNYFNFLYF